ncbi:SDR family oxidoreductase (plasmid) [Acidovorax sp. DW039]|uniref:SDR family NAD(P)-dependent oxidoreductase n=1 Tax=Acidovorax sp. DW039 TaxID=3095606 RepID=UPI003093195A|nr:SDR family oxidoreductase [Acidovorax sp. DW039]
MTLANHIKPSTSLRVLVTGGTSGIGLGIARAFSPFAEWVVATGATDLEVELARSNNSDIQFDRLDVRDANAVEQRVKALGDLDVVVNCAGIVRRGGQEHDPSVFEEVIDINLNGTMRVCTAARSGLKARRGCIVNTASMLSFFGGPLVPGYTASKGGVAQLTKSLAVAFADDGIRVNAIAPGWISTPLTQALQDDPARSQPIISRTPLGRWGTPQDVAGPVLFLASTAAAFVTGVILPVDGGYLAV